MFDIEREIALLTEAYCLEHNLPIRRHFTDAELEESIERIRIAAEYAQPLELGDFSPHTKVSEAQ